MLYIVPTPIGNLKDMTYRAVEVLKRVQVIYCEDTRTSQVLLRHYQISTPCESYHEHNEKSKTKVLIDRLQKGEDVALISDAGMPGIADPGFVAVQAAHAADLPVTVLPGASAVPVALVASGLASDRFYFGGFWPRKDKEAQALLEDLRQRKETAIFYESPHRVAKTLALWAAAFPEREGALCRELSKKFEEVRRMPVQELYLSINENPPKGEMVLLLAGAEEETASLSTALALAEEYIALGEKKSQAAKKAAQATGQERQAIYAALLREN